MALITKQQLLNTTKKIKSYIDKKSVRIKGNNETDYRIGDVNITANNIGASSEYKAAFNANSVGWYRVAELPLTFSSTLTILNEWNNSTPECKSFIISSSDDGEHKCKLKITQINHTDSSQKIIDYIRLVTDTEKQKNYLDIHYSINLSNQIKFIFNDYCTVTDNEIPTLYNNDTVIKEPEVSDGKNQTTFTILSTGGLIADRAKCDYNGNDLSTILSTSKRYYTYGKDTLTKKENQCDTIIFENIGSANNFVSINIGNIVSNDSLTFVVKNSYINFICSSGFWHEKLILISSKIKLTGMIHFTVERIGGAGNAIEGDSNYQFIILNGIIKECAFSNLYILGQYLPYNSGFTFNSCNIIVQSPWSITGTGSSGITYTAAGAIKVS